MLQVWYSLANLFIPVFLIRCPTPLPVRSPPVINAAPSFHSPVHSRRLLVQNQQGPPRPASPRLTSGETGLWRLTRPTPSNLLSRKVSELARLCCSNHDVVVHIRSFPGYLSLFAVCFHLRCDPPVRPVYVCHHRHRRVAAALRRLPHTHQPKGGSATGQS